MKIIGITGGSASGKTTFATLLKDEIGMDKTAIIHMDHYYLAEEKRPVSKSPINDNRYIDDNHPSSIDFISLIEDIEEYRNNSVEYLIIEGLFVIWNEIIYDLLDLKIFVECRTDERIVRRIKRNSQWGQDFGCITNVYLDLVRFRHDEYVEITKWKADIMINGSMISDHAVKMVKVYISSLVSA